ncbi:ABC transporter [Sporosarcina sp. P37]|uniref:ABC transporter ATP-binding protein n=1 Tax=unclassified Sporosarcina TaxID=2647733 RepID=UPI000A17E4E3|nr:MULTISPECIES: ABC transporter ATP-binding protein [unclassified Sporosarcina]ARK24068.1 ABC transporter [Sporosarcina sp. P37]PID18539.1 ABC transporter ATP-binding protein [Sporosarcina sp. P35]
MSNIIEVENVSKSFGDVKAVDNISFCVKKGRLFSFLGTNGAGKSTVISIILTVLHADSGNVTVNGYRVGKEDELIRKEIGVVFQDSLLDPLLTVLENLDIRAQLYGMTSHERKIAIEQCAKIADIHDIMKRRYGKLSVGQKRRADIARALLHLPKILLLDEPTTGLDPKSRQHIWNMIEKLQKDHGMTVFLTTHYIEEAANSDFVVVMKKGQIITEGTPGDLKHRYSADRLFIRTANHHEMRTQLQNEQLEFKEENGGFTVNLSNTLESIGILNRYKSLISSFEVRKSSLDDVFIRIHDRKDV